MPTFTGSTASETIDGSATADIIDGRGGSDTLNGLEGADVFQYRTGDGGWAPNNFPNYTGNAVLDGGLDNDQFQLFGGFHTLFDHYVYGGPNFEGYTYLTDVPYSIAAGTGGDVVFTYGTRLFDSRDGSESFNLSTATLRGVETLSLRFTEDPFVPEPFFVLSGNGYYHFTADDVVVIGDLAGTSLSGLIDFDGGTGNDSLDARAVSNTLLAYGGTGADRLHAGSANDQLFGEDGGDYLIGGAGSNLIDGGAGSDTADYSAAIQAVVIDLNDGVVTNNGYGLVDTLVSIENLVGGAFNDVLIGEASSNQIWGGLGSDYLIGLGGNDILEGGAGASNTLQGGLGDDTYIVDANDTLIEAASEGTDSVRTSLGAFTLRANFENLAYTGLGDFNGYGNALANSLVGGDGRDVLMGYDGNDSLSGGVGQANTLIGGRGDDRYISRAAGDTIVELAGEGHDTIDTNQLIYVLKDNFEDLIFAGNGGAFGTGNASGNLIQGNVGADVLWGLAGADVLRGMNGDDVIRGGAGNDQLDGGAGANDTVEYVTAAGGVSVNLQAGVASNDGDGGADTVVGFEHAVGSAFNDTLVGSAFINRLSGGLGADTLVGFGGNDVLDGGTGAANTLIGGLGDDLYRVSAVGDTVVENAGEGHDTVEATVNVILRAEIEDLRFMGTGAFTGTGNASNNHIWGGDGADILSGMAGDDILEGGDGPDIFRGGAGNDRFVGGGTGGDTADYSLAGSAVRVELLKTQVLNDGDSGVDTLISIENATGSNYDDVLVGTQGDNVLSGGLGRDSLIGYAGNDTLIGGAGVANVLQGGIGDDRYIVSAAGDSIYEVAGEGIDLVETALAAMTLAANVENLIYTGAGNFTGTGNAQANNITGGAGADTLSGRGGNDVITGGGGVDTVVMTGLQSDYAIAAGSGYFSITDNIAGRDGLDILYGVERVRFADGTIVELAAAPAPAPVEALFNKGAVAAAGVDEAPWAGHISLVTHQPWDQW